jgi:DNA-binding Xre family transcriptional regulator
LYIVVIIIDINTNKKGYKDMITLNIKKLILEKSVKIGKKLSYNDVSKETGITTAKLCRLANSHKFNLKSGTLENLLSYFEIMPNDLFSVNLNTPAPPVSVNLLQKEN